MRLLMMFLALVFVTSAFAQKSLYDWNNGIRIYKSYGDSYYIRGDNLSGSIRPTYGGGWTTRLDSYGDCGYGGYTSYTGRSYPTYGGYRTSYDVWGPDLNVYGTSRSKWTGSYDWDESGWIGRSYYNSYGYGYRNRR